MYGLSLFHNENTIILIIITIGIIIILGNFVWAEPGSYSWADENLQILSSNPVILVATRIAFLR